MYPFLLPSMIYFPLLYSMHILQLLYFHILSPTTLFYVKYSHLLICFYLFSHITISIYSYPSLYLNVIAYITLFSCIVPHFSILSAPDYFFIFSIIVLDHIHANKLKLLASQNGIQIISHKNTTFHENCKM